MNGHDESCDISEFTFGTIAFDLLDAMVAYWDRNFICRYANGAYMAWFGKSHGEMIGIHIKDLLGPLFEKNLPYIEGALKGEKQVFERDIPLPDGTVRHSLATYLPHVSGGEVLGFVAHVADVTRLKEYEATIQAQARVLASVNAKLKEEVAAHVAASMELNDRNMLVNALFKNAPMALITYDSTGQCTSVNPTACKLVGASEEVVLRQNYHEIHSWKESGLYPAALEAVETGAPVTREVFMRSTFGAEFWARVVFSTFESGGEECLLLMGEEITEARKARDEKEKLIKELQNALENIRTLEGILPICASCKKIRDTQGEWSSVESYVTRHSRAEFTHGICPDCIKKLYPEYGG